MILLYISYSSATSPTSGSSTSSTPILPRGDVIQISRQNGTGWQVETRRYDALSRLAGVTDHLGSTWANVYDMLGNRLSASDPDLGTWTYAYDAANRLTTQTDARGIQTGMTYDRLGRLLTRRINLPVVPDPVLTSNSYDQPRSGYYNIGHLTTSTNAARTQTFDYSANGGVQHKIESDATGNHDTFARLYNDDSVLYKTYAPNNLIVGTETNQWQYDGAGRLKSIPGMVTLQTYEVDGQTKSITYANGVTTSFTYDANRRWLQRIVTKNGEFDDSISIRAH